MLGGLEGESGLMTEEPDGFAIEASTSDTRGDGLLLGLGLLLKSDSSASFCAAVWLGRRSVLAGDALPVSG